MRSSKGKEIAPKEKTEPQLPMKSRARARCINFKIQTRLENFGPDWQCVAEGSVEFSLASSSTSN